MYVLVSLVGDEATREADDFALRFEKRRPPSESFHEPAPNLDDVSAEVAKARQALVFGHDGGGSLRAFAEGPPWATAEQFGKAFAGSRVYAFACKTMGTHLTDDDDVTAFGHAATRSGVSVFAGHCSWATASMEDSPADLAVAVWNALADVICAFLDGENDAGRLRLRAEESFDIIEAGFGGVPYAIHGMMQGLRISLSQETDG
ncbi:MAG: hypothetical protein JXR96_15025 [Deltaproteobacteria bacterium]|nr:hypothetical protein [Deltaproteobacteria bacterium]